MQVRVVGFLVAVGCVCGAPTAGPVGVGDAAGASELVKRGLVVLGHFVKGVKEAGRDLERLDGVHGHEYEYGGVVGAPARVTNAPLPENLEGFYAVLGKRRQEERKRASAEEYASALESVAAQRAVSVARARLTPTGGVGAPPLPPRRRTTAFPLAGAEPVYEEPAVSWRTTAV